MGPAISAPLDYFLHSAGPAAHPTMILGWVFAAICAAACLIVGGLLLGAVLRKRPTDESDKIGREGSGLHWIYIGTGISTAILFGLMIYTLAVLNQIAKPPTPPGLTITVTGYDWWWKVAYESSDPALRFVTANEIHIPVGVPVLVKLQSADVIHAFWAPYLAGKTQMIPGQTNQQWIEADTPGIYRGQCTQFCGAQHAHMAFEVVAQTPTSFAAWRQAQLKAAAPPYTAGSLAGQKIFMDQCSGCHTIRGTAAAGDHAPDLTHLGSRQMIAAGTLPNTRADLMNWIAHAQEIKPGSRMPDITLSPAEAAALADYLSTLQ